MKKLIIIIATAFILFGCSSQKSKAKEVLNNYLEGWKNFDADLIINNRKATSVNDEFDRFYRDIFKSRTEPDEIAIVQNIPKKTEFKVERFNINGDRGEAIIEIKSCDRGKILWEGNLVEPNERTESIDYFRRKGAQYSGECFEYGAMIFIDLVKIDGSWYVTNDGNLKIIGPLSGYIVR